MKVAATRLGIPLNEYMTNLDNGLKYCFKCNNWKPRDNFGNDSHRGDGLSAKCFSCSRVKVKKCTKGRPSPFKGKHFSEESKRKLSIAKKGHPSTRKGAKLTDAQRLNISNETKAHAVRGVNNPRWKGGISPKNQNDRHSFEMKEWRRKVFARDHFTCQQCGYTSGARNSLVAHHIKLFSENPESRFEVSNGITVCKACHQKIHSI